MIGAMIGDIVGSVYEWHNIKTKDFPFFSDNCFPTDDSIMTLAVAEALMAGGGEDQLIDSMKDWGRAYPGCRLWHTLWRMVAFPAARPLSQLGQWRGHAGLPLRPVGVPQGVSEGRL